MQQPTARPQKCLQRDTTGTLLIGRGKPLIQCRVIGTLESRASPYNCHGASPCTHRRRNGHITERATRPAASIPRDPRKGSHTRRLYVSRSPNRTSGRYQTTGKRVASLEPGIIRAAHVIQSGDLTHNGHIFEVDGPIATRRRQAQQGISRCDQSREDRCSPARSWEVA